MKRKLIKSSTLPPIVLFIQTLTRRVFMECMCVYDFLISANHFIFMFVIVLDTMCVLWSCVQRKKKYGTHPQQNMPHVKLPSQSLSRLFNRNLFLIGIPQPPKFMFCQGPLKKGHEFSRTHIEQLFEESLELHQDVEAARLGKGQLCKNASGNKFCVHFNSNFLFFNQVFVELVHSFSNFRNSFSKFQGTSQRTFPWPQ